MIRTLARARRRKALLLPVLLVPAHVSAGHLLAGPAVAQEPAERPHRLGVFFWHDSPNDEAAFAGIRQGLTAAGVAHELIERRADSDRERARRALAELRESGCELVFAMGTQAALLAAEHLGGLPVVYAAVSNPVASGVVADWGGSGRPLAGGTNRIPPATIAKVFRQAVPSLRRLGMLRSKTSGVVSAAELLTMREHLQGVPADPVPGDGAPAPPLEIVEEVAADADDLPRAVRALLDAGVQAVWIPIDFTVYSNLDRVRPLLDAARVPMVATAHNGARDGAVVAVTVDFQLHGRRVAALAVRILAGADPGALPVDTLHGYVVVANLAAARRIGHELPLPLLVRADTLLRDEPETGRDGR